jgi:hypothetical protein
MNKVICFTISGFSYIHKAMTMFETLTFPCDKILILSEKSENERQMLEFKKFLKSHYDIHCILLTELALPLEILQIRYDILELSTCIKSHAFKHLFSNNNEAHLIHYIDPDFYFYDDKLLAQMDSNFKCEKKIFVTPHTMTTKFTDNSIENITVPELFRVGYFNLGYIGISKGNEDFIDEFISLAENYGFSKPDLGMFTDQKIINHLLLKYNFRIEAILDYGFNVAYWNLYERSIKFSEKYKKFIIHETNEDLKSIHFSGFNEEAPFILTKHKFIPAERMNSELNLLTKDYSIHLKKNTNIIKPYLETTKPSRIDNIIINPSFKIWHKKNNNIFNCVKTIKDQINHDFLLENILNFKDLSAKFILNDKDIDYKSIKEWSTKYLELDSRAKYFSEILELINTNTKKERYSHKINFKISLIGWFSNTSGISEFAQELTKELFNNNISHNVIDANKQDDHLKLQSKLNIWCVNADNINLVIERFKVNLLETYNIGVFFWEIDFLPQEFIENAKLMDEIWVASKFIYDVFYSYGFRNIKIIPILTYFGRANEQQSLLKKNFFDKNVLTVFDYKSSFDRKNPLMVVDAFNSVPEKIQTKLTLKTINSNLFPHSRKKLFQHINENPKIELIESELDVQEMEELYLNSGVYVSLHRAEGLGLNLMKALKFGMEIISTNYGGPIDFLNPDNSFLINFKKIPIKSTTFDLFQYPFDGMWVEPDISEAKEILTGLLDGRVSKKNNSKVNMSVFEVQNKLDWTMFLHEIINFNKSSV